MDDTDDGACTDLNISVAFSPELHLREVNLDGHDLDELLRDAGRGDLHAKAESLAELPLDEGVEHLRTVLNAIFADPSGPPASEKEDSHV